MQGPICDADDALLRLRGAGHETRSKSSYFYDAATRTDVPHLTLQFTLSGKGFYQDATGRRVVETNSAWADVIPGRFSYGYPPESTAPYEHVFVSIGGTAAFEWQQRLHHDFGPVLQLGPGARNALVPMMLDIADAHARSELPDRYVLSSRLYQILMTLYSLMRTQEVTSRPRVARAIQIITLQASDPGFSVNQLSGILDCSREHLAREFRAATAQTPLEFLTEHRLRHAARLLRSDHAKLDVVARASGFSGANYFCRAFKIRTGVSPGEFRRRKSLTMG
jgi:AraC-like DNA-binding protein